MKHKVMFIIVLLLLGAATGLYGQWMYSKEAIVDQTTNAGTGYQIRFSVYYGAGTDAGENVYLDGKCKADFGDIRFFEGPTELDYWMESMTSGSVAVFWAQLAGNLDSAAIVVTLMYGNPIAVTTSNGNNTFEFFDDFSVDLTKWTKHKQLDGATITIPSGENYVRCGGTSSGTYGHTVLGSSATYANFANNAVEYRYRASTSGISEVGIRGTFGNPGTGYKGRSDARTTITPQAYGGQGILATPYYNWAFLADAGQDLDRPIANTWYRGTLTAYGTAMKLYRDGSLKRSSALGSVSGPGEISLQNHFGIYSDYDWVAVRKFAGTEPTRGAWNQEITLPVELSSFTAIPTAEYFVQLNWITQTETNVSGFRIYRGRSITLSEAINLNVFINATNTASTQTYTYLDNSVFEDGTYYYWLENIDLDGNTSFYGPIAALVYHNGNPGEVPEIPITIGIEKIFPNPFNPSTTISYLLENDAAVNVTVYNLKGQIVRQLFSGDRIAGNHRVDWNGMDDSGLPCSSGVYTVKVQIGSRIYTRNIVMSK